jgi:hypothetical protein
VSQQFKVARGTIRRPRTERKAGVKAASDVIGQGEIVPEGMLSPDQIAGLLEQGVIEPITTERETKMAESARRGKWSIDPAALAGKTLEDLIVMVVEIDPDYAIEGISSVSEAVTQLTADWHPAFREELARSSDKSRPAPLKTTTVKREDGKVISVEGAKDAGEPPMSDKAAAALERARERAKTPAPSAE